MSRRILLVEDEPGLVLTLTDRLMAEGYEVESEGDAVRGLARGSTGIVRRHPARRHAARRQRLRRVPHTSPARNPDADPDADRARAGRRSCRRIEARRRRLSGQAVRDGGVARAHRGIVRGVAPRRHRAAGVTETFRFGDIYDRLPQSRGHQGRPVESSCPRASSSFSATSSSIAVPHSHATSCSTRSGATTPCRPPERWTSTSPGCGRRSKTTRDIRNTFTPSTGSGINSSGDAGPQSAVHGPQSHASPRLHLLWIEHGYASRVSRGS